LDDRQGPCSSAPEGGWRAGNGPPKRIERRVKTRKTDDLNRFQKSRVNNHQQRTATTLKFNKFLGAATKHYRTWLEIFKLNRLKLRIYGKKS
jgi:hypothetical protein